MNINLLKISLGGIVGAISWLFGALDIALQTLLLFIVIDYFTGLTKAFKLKEIDSNIGFWGITKKVALLVVVVVSWRLDILVNANGVIRLIAIYGYIGSELFSIIQNLIALDVNIPTGLAKYFKNFIEQTEQKVPDIPPLGGNKNE